MKNLLLNCVGVVDISKLVNETYMNTNELTMKARSIARCLTYNEDYNQAEAKHMLLEMAHRLDTLNIRVHKKADGLLLINGIGRSRYATMKEWILFLLFGVFPREV